MRLVRRETELRQRRSGGDALVAMVQASDLGNGDDLTSSWALCRAFHWAIFGKREVCPGSMVVVDVGRENTPQVPLVEDDCIVQTVSADRADVEPGMGMITKPFALDALGAKVDLM